MARVKKTMRPIDSSKAVDSAPKVDMSFEFGPTRVTLEELDEFTKLGLFSWDLARLPEAKTVLDPHNDEAVMYRDFFMAGLRFPLHPLVIGV